VQAEDLAHGLVAHEAEGPGLGLVYAGAHLEGLSDGPEAEDADPVLAELHLLLALLGREVLLEGASDVGRDPLEGLFAAERGEDAGTIVEDREAEAAARDGDAPGTGVQRVLHKFRDGLPGIVLTVRDETDEIEGVRRLEADGSSRARRWPLPPRRTGTLRSRRLGIARGAHGSSVR
jgi:hypothetical protein